MFGLPCSSMVERFAVNEDVRGPSPLGGAQTPMYRIPAGGAEFSNFNFGSLELI